MFSLFLKMGKTILFLFFFKSRRRRKGRKMSHLLVEWSGMQVKFDGGGGDVWWYREADELAASYIPFKNIWRLMVK